MSEFVGNAGRNDSEISNCHERGYSENRSTTPYRGFPGVAPSRPAASIPSS